MTFGDKIDREKKISFKEGQDKLLISLVCQKLSKNMSVEEIAEDLETEESVIAEICEVASEFAPEYDQDAIFERMQKVNV